MKIITLIGIAVSAIVLTTGTISQKSAPDHVVKHETPPNGVRISDNFFCDKTEMDNSGWREYMSWTKHIFGSESPEYKAILPDTLSWLKADDCFEPYAEFYLQHPSYSYFPVVGISQKQAVAYSKWRSDRVFERMLVTKKLIDPNYVQSKENYFTIEKYYTGALGNMISDIKMKYYPEFRLPTLDERKIILAYSDSVDRAYFDKCKSKYCADCSENFPEMWSDIITCEGESDMIPATRNVEINCASKKGAPIFNLRGNVGEWTAAENITAGGGWKDKREEILDSDIFNHSEPNAWTGFRNVCEWKEWRD